MAQRFFLALLTVFIFYPIAGTVFAQITDEVDLDTPALTDIPLSESELHANISPEFPGPNESVTINLSSLGTNIDGTEINWKEDGKQKLGGIGKKTYVFRTKSVGTPTTITINAITPAGEKINKVITINPAGVDLLWQANDSIVPPFYKGKAMPSSEASIKFVSLPLIKGGDGSLVNQNDLIYTWRENYLPRPDDSGYGKNFFPVKMNYLHPNTTVQIVAQTKDGKISTSGMTQVTTGRPKILWYESSPLYGPQFDTALTNAYETEDSSLSIIAMPYFFSPANPASPKLKYTWLLNGKEIDTPAIPNTLFLQRGDSSKGKANLSITINNLGTLFQSATESLDLGLN